MGAIIPGDPQPNFYVCAPIRKHHARWFSGNAAREADIGDIAPLYAEAGGEAKGRSLFTDARLEQAYLYWRSKAGTRAMPSRADIDPTEIPRLLPDVMLVECLDGRYRYRLIGTENASAQGVNATGRFLDQVLPGPDYRAHVLALYDECVAQRRPLYSECLFFAPSRREPERHTKVLFMPLSSDGERVNMVFVVQVFHYIDRATRERHFVEARPYKEIVHILV
ncbi:MAG: PAS domain-containing protein [Alphaproteobacteria bacterium]|nr:PAS domain-containing protein [Alphaproteobacteria bacterium]MBV9554593.1 PAS domain-containing protein [Alphaproteobacteria bacterium]